LVKRWIHRPKGIGFGFDPRLDHKRRSTLATNKVSPCEIIKIC
jgi:hypothetical protein